MSTAMLICLPFGQPVFAIWFRSPSSFFCVFSFSFLPLASSNSHPNPHSFLDRIPTNGTNVDLPRAAQARAHMPAGEEEGIHFLLVADLTEFDLLIRDLEIHPTLPVTSAALPSARVDVAGGMVGHAAFAVGFIVGPVAGVNVLVGVDHVAVAAVLLAGSHGACVGVAGGGDDGGVAAVGATVPLRAGEVGAAEVGGGAAGITGKLRFVGLGG